MTFAERGFAGVKGCHISSAEGVIVFITYLQFSDGFYFLLCLVDPCRLSALIFLHGVSCCLGVVNLRFLICCALLVYSGFLYSNFDVPSLAEHYLIQ
jgi:hypothetical protein